MTALLPTRVCRVCGCTNDNPCCLVDPKETGWRAIVKWCSWAELDLCSACVPGAAPDWKHPSIRSGCDSGTGENATIKEGAVDAAMDTANVDPGIVRIENVALRAEVERLRRELEEARARNASFPPEDREAFQRIIRAKDRRIDRFRKEAEILLEQLDGENPAWWMQAARAMMALRRECEGPISVGESPREVPWTN